VNRIMGKPHSGTSSAAAQGSRRNDNAGVPPEAAEARSVDSRNTAAVDEAEPEQPPLSEELMAELRSIEARFDELPASGRRVLLAKWLTKFRWRVGHFRCIDELIDAFIEAERGLHPPLFTPKDASGRPPLPLIVADIRSAAALAMDALMQAGMGKQDAARAVAKRIGYSVTDRQAWNKVAKWRDELARAVGDKSRYSDDFRLHARLHEELRADLFCALNERGEDPHVLAADQYTRIDQLRQRLNREKGADLSSI
jgi:hypothetical protein